MEREGRENKSLISGDVYTRTSTFFSEFRRLESVPHSVKALAEKHREKNNWLEKNRSKHK